MSCWPDLLSSPQGPELPPPFPPTPDPRPQIFRPSSLWLLSLLPQNWRSLWIHRASLNSCLLYGHVVLLYILISSTQAMSISILSLFIFHWWTSGWSPFFYEFTINLVWYIELLRPFAGSALKAFLSLATFFFASPRIPSFLFPLGGYFLIYFYTSSCSSSSQYRRWNPSSLLQHSYLPFLQSLPSSLDFPSCVFSPASNSKYLQPAACGLLFTAPPAPYSSKPSTIFWAYSPPFDTTGSFCFLLLHRNLTYSSVQFKRQTSLPFFFCRALQSLKSLPLGLSVYSSLFLPLRQPFSISCQYLWNIFFSFTCQIHLYLYWKKKSFLV